MWVASGVSITRTISSSTRDGNGPSTCQQRAGRVYLVEQVPGRPGRPDELPLNGTPLVQPVEAVATGVCPVRRSDPRCTRRGASTCRAPIQTFRPPVVSTNWFHHVVTRHRGMLIGQPATLSRSRRPSEIHLKLAVWLSRALPRLPPVTGNERHRGRKPSVSCPLGAMVMRSACVMRGAFDGCGNQAPAARPSGADDHDGAGADDHDGIAWAAHEQDDPPHGRRRD